MRYLFKSALLKLALFLFIGWLVGIQLQAVWLSLLVALSLYIAFFLAGYYRFLAWLDSTDFSHNSFASSSWASLAARIRKRIVQIEGEKNKVNIEKAFLGDILDALGHAVMVVDAADRIVWANRAAKPIMGIDQQADRGRNLLNLYRAPEFHKYLSRGSYAAPIVIDSPYDRSVKLELRVHRFVENRLLVARDVSEDTKLQTIREDFIANVSHELKTPLTVIAGYLELLKEHEVELPDRWLNAVDQMQGQSQRMEDLVSDLIMLSRLETVEPAVQNQTVYILELLQSIVEEARISAAGKKITLSVEGEQLTGNKIYLDGNEKELRSAFDNIIQNAIRYTGPSGEIDIRCYLYYQTFRVGIDDNGAGIAQEHLPRLTERFYRADESRTAATGGTGLGLAIVKHVLSRHQGILEVASTLGKGSTFTCVFPLAKLHYEKN